MGSSRTRDVTGSPNLLHSMSQCCAFLIERKQGKTSRQRRCKLRLREKCSHVGSRSARGGRGQTMERRAAATSAGGVCISPIGSRLPSLSITLALDNCRLYQTLKRTFPTNKFSRATQVWLAVVLIALLGELRIRTPHSFRGRWRGNTSLMNHVCTSQD